MDLPDSLKFKHVFIQGGAFSAKLDRDKVYGRYYFVLNDDPDNDVVTLLMSSTTDYDSHKECEGPESIHIPLRKDEYLGIDKPCILCCNWIIPINRKELERQLNSRRFSILDPLPDEILSKIIQGVKDSPTIERMHKIKIVQDYEAKVAKIIGDDKQKSA